MSPLEPSESMRTLKDGLVNAGAILFVLALLATLILGRFFCGWGCHIILLQDPCAWLLGKVGIRPKPFRSRLSSSCRSSSPSRHTSVWPVSTGSPSRLRPARAGLAGGPLELVVDESSGAPFRRPDGRAAPARVRLPRPVYFLGAPGGYRTYGGPRTQVSSPLDESAPVYPRRPTPAKSAAICTRGLHEHTRPACTRRSAILRMVVDPGCMKPCPTASASCPKEALDLGLGWRGDGAGAAGGDPPGHAPDLGLGEEIGVAAVARSSLPRSAAPTASRCRCSSPRGSRRARPTWCGRACGRLAARRSTAPAPARDKGVGRARRPPWIAASVVLVALAPGASC